MATPGTYAILTEDTGIYGGLGSPGKESVAGDAAGDG